MALSRASNGIAALVAGVPGALFVVLALAAGTCAHAAANPLNCPKIDIDGTDLGTKLSKSKGGDTSINLDKVKISGCDTEIVAKHAHGTSLDFDDSTWTFTGDVNIRLGEQQSKLSAADEAVVKFRNNEVERLTVKGSPVQFEQKRPKSDEVTRGHANNIVYESQPGTISLQDDVWLNNSGKEFTGANLVYDIRNAEVSNTAGSGDRSGQRIHITINPQAAKDQKKKDEDKKPPAATPP